ncbi:MAG TPA: bifunctional diaminohydroxyphosphoribosylaminopyrimidine deaminase/5-amino-6-(5-phosphoribosylamino)uracil reductase RibD [Saprospiraceae bacterium]|nr:bifunctional diaminohydroxyphosphoribosylaminopyrimidine deaminase/5-amino-6-(5-phosphoribosylamino)uracil reductase RibD [Saprospiraceae bacterium]
MDEVRAEKYLSYCFYLARLGSGSVSPNPKVGAVLVYQDRIIGEGYHQQFGGPHAEVLAIDSVRPEDKHLISQSTLIVSLEPCNHYGKTGPCTEFILKNHIPELVFSTLDPNPLMSGKSINLLKANGVNTNGPYLEQDGQELIREYSCGIKNQRPYVILKFAQTADYFLGASDEQTKISSFASDICAHRWRAEADAIVVGKNTVLIDNPTLNSRHWNGKNPIRIVLARFGMEQRSHLNVFNLEAPSFDLSDLGLGECYTANQLLSKLYEKKIGIVLVEGGAKTLKFFYESGLWDEARIITNTELKIGKGISAPSIRGQLVKTVTLNKDTIHYIAKNSDY